MVPLSFLSKDPRHWRVFCAQKTAQNIKRAGGCEYWSFGLYFCKSIYTYLVTSNVRAIDMNEACSVVFVHSPFVVLFEGKELSLESGSALLVRGGCPY